MMRLTRDLSRAARETCHQGPDDVLPKGTIVYRCVQPTYGCITHRGTAVTFDPEGGYPFFEVLTDALETAP